jgi:penicillin-binding protein-related factor A (putative recombinase)
MPTPEGLIKKSICEYLTYMGVFFWVNSSTGIYDAKRKIFRANKSPYQKRGVPDILGIYKGKPFACEVKSATGRLSNEQKAFMAEYAFHGAFCFMARSVDDVIRELKNLDVRVE